MLDIRKAYQERAITRREAHELFDSALSLPDLEIGDAVRFAHQPKEGKVYHITGVTTMTSDGSPMVMLDGLPGEFAPSVFVKAN